MKTNIKSLLIIALLTLIMSFSTKTSASENKYETLNANELSNLTIDELLSVDFSELIAISNKIADNSNESQIASEIIEVPIVVLADLDLTSLMAVTNQVTIESDKTQCADIIRIPFTAFTAIDLNTLIKLSDSCANYKETHPDLALNSK